MIRCNCAKCGREFHPGELRYRIDIRIIADFDGVINVDPSLDNKAEIERLIRELEEMDPVLIEEEIHQEINYLLCRECRDQFAANPLDLPLESDIPDTIP